MTREQAIANLEECGVWIDMKEHLTDERIKALYLATLEEEIEIDGRD